MAWVWAGGDGKWQHPYRFNRELNNPLPTGILAQVHDNPLGHGDYTMIRIASCLIGIFARREARRSRTRCPAGRQAAAQDDGRKQAKPKCRWPRPLSFLVPTVTLSLLFLHPITSDAGRRISLPFVEHLDTADSIKDLAWATQGGTVTWLADGGWRGSGGVKITAPHINGDQGYAGLGSFDVGRQMRLNVRFLIYFGSSFQEQVQMNKLLIVLRDKQGIDLGSLRPMIMENQRIQGGREHRYWYPCRGVVECSKPKLDKFTVSGARNANEWVCFELETDLIAEHINLYIHTADGRHKGISSSVSLANERNEVAALNGGVSRPPADFPIYQVQILGGFWGWSNGRDGGVVGSNRDANAYIKIDEIAIDSQYIGCPAGFHGKPLVGRSSSTSPRTEPAQ